MAPIDPVALAERMLAAAEGPKDAVLAALNGALGDRLAASGSALAIEMALLQPDPWRPLGEPPLQRSTGACVLVHGLMGNERSWAIGTAGGTRRELGAALAEAHGLAPIYVRYNSGLHISTNGRELADRLEHAFADWSALEDISIVAHSMGGLVTRSALHYAQLAGHAWPARVRRVFLLGVPSHGAPLEQLVHVAAFTLATIWNPWTKIIGKAMNLRSAGIKDLRHGYVLDEDWHARDPDVLALRAPRRALAIEHARWYVAAATLGARDGVLARVLGDGLVLGRSSQGRGFGSPAPGVLPKAEVRVFDRTSHIGLMSDPAVLEQILQWWDG